MYLPNQQIHSYHISGAFVLLAYPPKNERANVRADDDLKSYPPEVSHPSNIQSKFDDDPFNHLAVT